MSPRSLVAALALAATLAAGCSMMPPLSSTQPAQVADGLLVGKNGMTLYTFDRDAAGSGKSVCNGPCATNWPPLMVDAGASGGGDWSVVTRDDGGKQWAFKGKPVYFWAKDMKAGDKTGDGFNGVWHAVKP